MHFVKFEDPTGVGGRQIDRLLSHETLLDDEVRRCILAWQKEKDIAARDRVVTHHQHLAAKVAQKYLRRGQTMEFQDLVSYGNLGLLRAIDKYDFREGVKFSTYAWDWVENFIRKALTELSQTVRVPRTAQEKVRRGGTLPSTALVFKVSPDTFSTSIDGQSPDDRGFFGVTYQPELKEKFDGDTILNSLEQYGLNKREALYMRMHFRDEMDFKTIGEKLGVTRQAVNAGILRGIAKLQEVFADAA